MDILRSGRASVRIPDSNTADDLLSCLTFVWRFVTRLAQKEQDGVQYVSDLHHDLLIVPMTIAISAYPSTDPFIVLLVALQVITILGLLYYY